MTDMIQDISQTLVMIIWRG